MINECTKEDPEAQGTGSDRALPCSPLLSSRLCTVFGQNEKGNEIQHLCYSKAKAGGNYDTSLSDLAALGWRAGVRPRRIHQDYY